MKRIIVVLSEIVAIMLIGYGCGIRGYRMAGGDGDLTHAPEPGARVVVPNYVLAFAPPNIDCKEIGHRVGSAINEYACPQTTTNLTADAPCDESLWAHIYNPKRLHVKQPCISITGTTVDATKGKQKDGCRHEADGDAHCWLRLDKGQEGLLVDGNIVRQDSNLVFEPICRYRVTQADAMGACKNWQQKLDLPTIGSHVRITGAYVYDAQHKHTEIHPVTKIEVLSIILPAARSCTDEGKVYWPARPDGQCYAADKPK